MKMIASARENQWIVKKLGKLSGMLLNIHVGVCSIFGPLIRFEPIH